MTACEPPDVVATRDRVLGEVVRFARQLRAEGVAVPADASQAAAAALAEVGLADRAAVRAATSATLVADARDHGAFDDAFPTFWYRLRTGLEAAAAHDDGEERGGDEGTRTDATGPVPSPAATDVLDAAEADPAGDGPDGDATDGEPLTRRVADRESEGTPAPADEDRTSAGTGSAAGRRAAVGSTAPATSIDDATIQRFVQALASLPGRRSSPGDGGRVDARRALRRTVGGGAALPLPRRERDPTALRAAVLADVSRSVLDAVDRPFLLGLLAGLVREGRSVRTFLFDTDVQEVTDVFEGERGDPVAALDRAEVAWGGGTRIGESLAALRERWPRAVDRRTVTVVVSDGLETGDVDRLERELARLARRSRVVLWLNPLAASPAYEPTARGMAAALPYVDGLFACSGAADLAEVARQLERHGAGGPVGYEHDFRDRTTTGGRGAA